MNGILPEPVNGHWIAAFALPSGTVLWLRNVDREALVADVRALQGQTLVVPGATKRTDAPRGPETARNGAAVSRTPSTAAGMANGDACPACGRLELRRESSCRSRCAACGTVDGGCS